MAEQLGAAELQLDVNSGNFKTKLDAAEAQLLGLQRVADSVGTSLNNIFGKTYRLNINDSQLNAANIRLDNTLKKLREITAQPYNVRLNFLQSGLGTGGGGKFDPASVVDDAIGKILKQGLSGQAADILRGGGGGGGAGASQVGAARTQQLRETLLARLERGSLGAGGFNIPGLQEITRQLGQTPLARSAGRAKILQQARETIQQASDAVINRIGQDLLDLQLSLQEEGVNAPKKAKQKRILRPQGGARNPIRSQEQAEQRVLDNQLRIDKLEARGVDVNRLRQQLAEQEAAVQERAFERSRRISVELQRQLKTQEALLQVERLRAATARQQAAVDRAQLGPKPPPPPPLPPSGGGDRNLLQRLGLGAGGKGGGPLRGSPRDAISSGLIGFGFPLLFGQGLGAAVGGGIGGGAGGLLGGGFGFALSIIGTAVGAQFDVIINKSKDLATALRDPIAGFELLKQNSQLSSRGTERYIESLIKVGREAEAAALIQQDLSNTYGNLENARALSAAQDELARSWTRLSGVLGRILLPGVVALTRGLTAIFNTAAPEPKAPTAPPPEVLEAQRTRSALLGNELRLITAQAQGYKELEIQLKSAVVADRERLDLAVLRQRALQSSVEDWPAIRAEIEARRNQTLKETIQLEAELTEVRRKSAITQEFRPALLRQSLALLNAQTTGAQRQALIEERRLAALETEKQLRLEGNRDPVRRSEIQDQGLLTQARLTAQLAQLDKDRAAFIRQTTFDSKQQAQAGQRQLDFARQRLTTEAGISRQTLEQRQAVTESIEAARTRQQSAQFALVESLRQGGDAGQQRAIELATKELPEAGRQLQLSLLNGATTLRDAAVEIGRSIRDNGRALQDLYLTSPFATGEQRQQALADLERQVQAEAERRNVRFTLFGGTEEQRTAAKREFVDFGRQEQQIIRQGKQLAEAFTTATEPLITSNTNIVASNNNLITALNALLEKNWNVSLSVAPNGSVTGGGDLVPTFL